VSGLGGTIGTMKLEMLYAECWKLSGRTFHLEVLTDRLGCCTTINWTALVRGVPYQLMIPILENGRTTGDPIDLLRTLLEQAHSCLQEVAARPSSPTAGS
jgi:hypothetical protein